MILLNKNSNDGLFPFDSYQIYIDKNDKGEPKIHVNSQKYEVVISIKEVCILNMLKYPENNTDVDELNYIILNIPEWLKFNRDKCQEIWKIEGLYGDLGNINDNQTSDDILIDIPDIDIYERARNLTDEEKEALLAEKPLLNLYDKDGLFPVDKYQIRIYAIEKGGPKFHVIKDGWDIQILLENGQVLDIVERGENEEDINYISENINKWLDEPNKWCGSMTNREYVDTSWEMRGLGDEIMQKVIWL